MLALSDRDSRDSSSLWKMMIMTMMVMMMLILATLMPVLAECSLGTKHHVSPLYGLIPLLILTIMIIRCEYCPH